jgi:hypothetical protein
VTTTRRVFVGAALVAHLTVLLATTRTMVPFGSEELTAEVALSPSAPTQDLMFTTEVPYGSRAYVAVHLDVVHDGAEGGTIAVVPVAPVDVAEGSPWYDHTFEGDAVPHALREGPTVSIDPELTAHHLRLTWDGAAPVVGTVTLSVWAEVWTEREARREDPPEIAWD